MTALGDTLTDLLGLALTLVDGLTETLTDGDGLENVVVSTGITVPGSSSSVQAESPRPVSARAAMAKAVLNLFTVDLTDRYAPGCGCLSEL